MVLKKGKKKIKTNNGKVSLDINSNHVLVSTNDAGTEKYIGIIGSPTKND